MERIRLKTIQNSHLFAVLQFAVCLPTKCAHNEAWPVVHWRALARGSANESPELTRGRTDERPGPTRDSRCSRWQQSPCHFKVKYEIIIKLKKNKIKPPHSSTSRGSRAQQCANEVRRGILGEYQHPGRGIQLEHPALHLASLSLL